MANYCSNFLKVQGEEDELTEFMKKFVVEDEKGRDSFEFNNIVVRPKEFDEGEKWYHWNIENWGTKWSPYNESCNVDYYEEGEGNAEFSFDTAWSPCTNFIENASKIYKGLTFILRYEESGCGFMGVAKAHNGVLEDKCIEY
jgi:hypothetical protein